MKSKILIKIILIQLVAILFVTTCVIGQPIDPSIAQTSTKNQQKMQTDSSLNERVTVIEERIKNNDERVVLNLKQSTLIVEIMGIFLTIFLSWLGFYSLYNFNKLKKEIEQTNTEAKEKLIEVSTIVNTKVEEFNQTVNVKLEELKMVYDKVFEIENKLVGNQTYLHQSLDKLYELLQISANLKNDNDFLNMIFINRAASSLYSYDDEERFTGITTLGAKGNLSDIKHLEYVLLNPNESNINKLLANKSIVSIKTRKPETN